MKQRASFTELESEPADGDKSRADSTKLDEIYLEACEAIAGLIDVNDAIATEPAHSKAESIELHERIIPIAEQRLEETENATINAMHESRSES